MKTKTKSDRWARRIGILFGLAIAAAALASWRVPAGGHALGASLRVNAIQTGEIGVAPLHPFVSARSLQPGAAASGSVSLRNQTAAPLAVRFRALPSIRDLDALLRVRVTAGGRVLYDGSLGGLRATTRRALALAPGQRRKLGMRAWIATGAKRGFQGRMDDVSFELRSERS